MKLIKRIMAIAAGVVLCASLVPTTTEAAETGIPLTCGMAIDGDAAIYLNNNLRCPDFAVRIEGIFPDGNLSPHVTVDLRGHTLTGSGSSDGIVALGDPFTAPDLEVKNGQLDGWDVAIFGSWDTSVRNVALTRNRVAVLCNNTCTVERSYFGRNSESGFSGGEAIARISKSIFYRNAIGARVFNLSGLTVSSSVFVANGTGVAGYPQSLLSVSRSTFIKNETAVSYATGDTNGCASLTKNRFVRNVVKVNGPIC